MQASPTQALHEIREQGQAKVASDVNTKRVETLVEAGAIDPAKTVARVLELAFTHAKSVLQTEDRDLDGQQRLMAD